MPQMVGNLSIRSKLLGLLAVAVAGSVLLAVAGVADAAGDGRSAGRERRAAVLAGLAGGLAHQLQEERLRAAAWVAGGGRRGGAELVARRQRVDRAVAAYRAGAAGLDRSGDPALGRALDAAADRFDHLPAIRAGTDRRSVAPVRVLADYDAVVDTLRAVQRGLASVLQDRELARGTGLLLAVATAKEVTGQERGLLAAAPPADRLAPEVLASLVPAAAVAGHELAAVRATAGGRLDVVDRALATPGSRTARRLELALLDAPPTGARPASEDLADPGVWRGALSSRAGALWRVERGLAEDLGRLAGAGVVPAERRARNLLLLLVAAVGVVALVLVPVLRRTRAGAGPGAEVAAGPTLLGLARRGQALLDRQLQLIDELEREEPDPDRLQAFFRLDHLATRLRRNAETLLAVAGPEPARRWDRPVPVAGLLRAAIAEVDDYRRVELLALDEVEVAGPAGVDLVHLLAELLDNAAAFSPPTAGVAVTGMGAGDGYLIEVSDRGLGMSDEELALAGRRLAGERPADPDRLGLVVAGRLAARHAIQVRLVSSPDGGVTAAVRLPATLLRARPTAAATPALGPPLVRP
jgi:signal transduction histidine kinase